MQFADCCMPIMKLITVGVDLITIATRLSLPFAPLAARLSSKPDYNVTIYNTGDACHALGYKEYIRDKSVQPRMYNYVFLK